MYYWNIRRIVQKIINHDNAEDDFSIDIRRKSQRTQTDII